MRDIARRAGQPSSSPIGRTTCTGSTWACSPRAPRSSRTRTTRSPASRCVGRERRALRARLSGDGVADDRVGARPPLRAPARRGAAWRERSVIVFGAMEATLTPLMEAIEARFPGIKVFSLPSVDHPQWGRHIELGVKGEAARIDAAYAALLDGLRALASSSAPNWCDQPRPSLRFGASVRTDSDAPERRRVDCTGRRTRGGSPSRFSGPAQPGARHAFCYIPVRVFGARRPLWNAVSSHPTPNKHPARRSLMAKTVADVMKMVKENEVKFVDFRFTDTRGKEQHVIRARLRLRRRQVHVRPRLRRLLDRRLEGHRGLGHAADARPEHRQHRPVLRRADADPHLRRDRAGRRQALRARSALARQARRGLPEVVGPRRHRLLRPRARVLRLRQRALGRRHVGLLLEDRIRRSGLEHRARSTSTATPATARPSRAATSRCRRSIRSRTCAPRCA